MNVNQKGDFAVGKVCLEALARGWLVSVPLNNTSRYDLILDSGLSPLLRVQVKYADGKSTHSEGVARVSLSKPQKDSYDEKEIDLLLVYVPKIDRICSFAPKDFCGKQNILIRYNPAKNGQLKNCIHAEEYFW